MSREEAISKGKRCLDEYIIGGIPTTISLLSQVISTKEFKESQIHVKFLEENFKIKDISEEELLVIDQVRLIFLLTIMKVNHWHPRDLEKLVWI